MFQVQIVVFQDKRLQAELQSALGEISTHANHSYRDSYFDSAVVLLCEFYVLV